MGRRWGAIEWWVVVMLPVGLMRAEKEIGKISGVAQAQ